MNEKKLIGGVVTMLIGEILMIASKKLLVSVELLVLGVIVAFAGIALSIWSLEREENELFWKMSYENYKKN